MTLEPDLFKSLSELLEHLRTANKNYNGEGCIAEIWRGKETVKKFHAVTKKLLIRMNFEALQKHGLVLDHNSIANKLLSYLEPFPFDTNKLEKIKYNSLCIGKIRDIIENQYLSYKYRVDERKIGELLFRFKLCLYPFRSIRNLRRNILLLESVPEIRERSVAEKIYLINQKPFDINVIKTFEEKVVGVSWYKFPQHCFKILCHSHEYILFIVSFLQYLKFTERQIQEGLPFLHLPFVNIIRKLNNLLKNSEMSKYRNEDFFLHLLFFSRREILRLGNISFTELIEIVRISRKSTTEFLTLSIVRDIVSQFYEIESSYFDIISRHPKYNMLSEKQIHDTLFFLKENNFTTKEVAESITIIFYPREIVAKTLEKIKQEETILKKNGFNDGYVSETTNFFATGTKEKRKTLQLCLYYIKKFYFSGNELKWAESDAMKDSVIAVTRK